MDNQPTDTFDLASSSLLSTMNLVDSYPRLDEGFAYSGDGADLSSGFPGYNSNVSCEWNVGCWFGLPATETQLADLRELPWGLGQATTGYYNQDTGGYKSFGAQG